MELLSGLPAHLHPLDVAARLEEFRALEDGWFEGTGKAPDFKGLDWLADQFNRNFPDDLPLPYTFPTPKGGVEMEWLFDSQSIHLEIDIVGHRGNWLRYDKYVDGNEEERDLDLNDESDWSWFAGEIRRFFAEHVLIDFRNFGTNQIKRKAGRLRDAALARGWQYRP